MDIKLTATMLWLISGMEQGERNRLFQILLDIARGHDADLEDIGADSAIIVEEITKAAIKDTKSEREKARQHEKYIRAKAAKAADTEQQQQPKQQPPDVNGVMRIAAEIGAKCHNQDDAALYIASRERTAWKVNGNQVVNFAADIKAFFLSKESNERAKRGFDNKAISQDYSQGVL